MTGKMIVRKKFPLGEAFEGHVRQVLNTLSRRCLTAMTPGMDYRVVFQGVTVVRLGEEWEGLTAEADVVLLRADDAEVGDVVSDGTPWVRDDDRFQAVYMGGRLYGWLKVR